MEKEKVSDVEKLFYRPERKKGAIEGYLGNPEEDMKRFQKSFG